ncbi:MAG: transcription antitermination protein, NusG family/antiterminator LoaP [Treponematales bacterium]
MNYYAMQVRTGGEEKYMRLFKVRHPEVRFPFHFPKRIVRVRRKNKQFEETAAVFPGYLFVEAEETGAVAEALWQYRRVDGFCRFLRSNQDICPLAGRDLETVLYFIRRVGPLAGTSKVRFDENDRIVVVDGPLFGLTGNIIKVDKRKKWAKVQLDLYGDSFAINLAIDILGEAR